MLRVVAYLVLVCGIASAAPDPFALIDQLGSPDRTTVERAVIEVEHAASSRDLADAMFRAGLACEDTLRDPARALAIYERIVRDLPDTRSAGSAARKATALRGEIGAAGEHAREAADFATLVAEADALDAAEVRTRASRLAQIDWPGAPEVVLWLAEWLRRTGQFAEAQTRYTEVIARWPHTRHEALAIRGAAGNALDARDWDLAEQLADQLPVIDEADRIVQADLIAIAGRGRQVDHWYWLAWLIAAAAIAALAGSLLEASRRGGWIRPRLKPPVEVVFLAPIAAVLIGVAFTTHRLIAPAVAILAIGGLALAWLSGAALDTLRARNRPVRGRALTHVAICVFAVLALLFVALVRDNLLEMVIETVRFGPEP